MATFAPSITSVIIRHCGWSVQFFAGSATQVALMGCVINKDAPLEWRAPGKDVSGDGPCRSMTEGADLGQTGEFARIEQAILPAAAHEAERRDQPAELQVLHHQRPRGHGHTEAGDGRLEQEIEMLEALPLRRIDGRRLAARQPIRPGIGARLGWRTCDVAAQRVGAACGARRAWDCRPDRSPRS